MIFHSPSSTNMFHIFLFAAELSNAIQIYPSTDVQSNKLSTSLDEAQTRHVLRDDVIIVVLFSNILRENMLIAWYMRHIYGT